MLFATNPQHFNVTIIIAFLKFFLKFYLFIKKLFFFFFWPSLHFKDEETGSELACVSSELEFKGRLAPMLCSFSKPHSPSQNFLPLVTVIGVSVTNGVAQVLKSSSGDNHCPWMIVMVALLANPPSAKAGSCHAEEVNQRHNKALSP